MVQEDDWYSILQKYGCIQATISGNQSYASPDTELDAGTCINGDMRLWMSIRPRAKHIKLNDNTL